MPIIIWLLTCIGVFTIGLWVKDLGLHHDLVNLGVGIGMATVSVWMFNNLKSKP